MKAQIRTTTKFYTLLMLIALVAFSLPTTSLALDNLFVDVVKKVNPAVVKITSVGAATGQKLIPDDLRDDLENTPLMSILKELYGDKLEEKLQGKVSTGMGAGSILSKDGYILTNYHVVQYANKIYVQLNDRREFEAKLIGYDEGTDLAVIKISANNLPFIELNPNTNVEIGEWVLAIGAPFGYDHSASVGIISAKGRSLGQERYVPFLQSDVAINPGNSGGPLFNIKGEIVGINSQIVSESGNFSGLSFAVPANVAGYVFNQIIKNGNVRRGWVGLAFQDLSRELAESFGVDKVKGALVAKVMPDSPASEAGMQPGDIILAFNNHEIFNAKDLSPVMGLVKPGTTVPMQVVRNKQVIQVNLTVKAAPNRNQVLASVTYPKVKLSLPFGIDVRPLEAQEKMALKQKAIGVVVEKVESSYWQQAGVRAGDIIMAVDHDEVNSEIGFYQALKKASKEKTIPILITRPGEVQYYLAIDLQKVLLKN